jgi:hypothetical protein
MTVHVEDVRATGYVIEPVNPRINRIEVDKNVALRLGGCCRVVDVRNEEPLDTFALAIQRLGAEFHIIVDR